MTAVEANILISLSNEQLGYCDKDIPEIETVVKRNADSTYYNYE